MDTTFQQLGIALLMGLLVGLQREHAASPLAGLRTFPLITILGSVCALIDQKMGWPGVTVAVFDSDPVAEGRLRTASARHAALGRMLDRTDPGMVS